MVEGSFDGGCFAESERAALLKKVLARRAIYETKRDAANPYAEVTENVHDRYSFAVEAFDVLLTELGYEA